MKKSKFDLLYESFLNAMVTETDIPDEEYEEVEGEYRYKGYNLQFIFRGATNKYIFTVTAPDNSLIYNSLDEGFEYNKISDAEIYAEQWVDDKIDRNYFKDENVREKLEADQKADDMWDRYYDWEDTEKIRYKLKREAEEGSRN